MQMPQNALTLITALEKAGETAYFVGGCVRDSLLDTTPQDWDICTSALPDKVVSLFEGPFKVIETGIAHGTVTVVAGGEGYEITTFRTDGPYTDHRRPDRVKLGASLTEDLARRDFTINAMALSAAGQLFDPFSGRQDLQAGIIRCVGRAEKRFGEDALRILRALRFASQLDFSLHPETLAAAKACAGQLRFVAAERKAVELQKLLCGKAAARVLVEGGEILAHVIPEIAPCIGFDMKSPYHDRTLWQHTADAVGAAPPEPVIRWALLLHDIAKPRCFTVDSEGKGHSYGHGVEGEKMSRQILRGLRVSNSLQDQVCALVHYHDAQLPLTRAGVRRWLAKLGQQGVQQLLEVKAADISAHAPHPSVQGRGNTVENFKEMLCHEVAQGACFKTSQLAIKGGDIVKAGLCPPGPGLGQLLNALLEEVIEGRVENQPQPLLACARKLCETEENQA